MLRVVERLFLCDRTGSGRPVPCQSLRLVSCAWQALRSGLIPFACECRSFPLAMAHEGQWKRMSLMEDLKDIGKNRSIFSIPQFIYDRIRITVPRPTSFCRVCLEKKTFLSLALRGLWARGRNRSNERCVSAVSEGFTKAMTPSEATGVAFVARSHCGLIEIT